MNIAELENIELACADVPALSVERAPEYRETRLLDSAKRSADLDKRTRKLNRLNQRGLVSDYDKATDSFASLVDLEREFDYPVDGLLAKFEPGCPESVLRFITSAPSYVERLCTALRRAWADLETAKSREGRARAAMKQAEIQRDQLIGLFHRAREPLLAVAELLQETDGGAS